MAAPPSSAPSGTSSADGPRSHPVDRTVIGRSVQNRDIIEWRFGAGARKVLVVGGIHGDEYGADVAERLLAAFAADPGLVRNGVEVHVIPDLNPDGRSAHTRGNANRVDLNLNMPASNWKRVLNPQTSAAQHGLNGGSGAGSEPETQALLRSLDQKYDLVISLHSSGGIVDWDGVGGEAIAKRMARIAGLKAEHLAVQPYATGTMGQYVPEAFRIPVITVELSSRSLDRPLRDAILGAVAGVSSTP